MTVAGTLYGVGVGPGDPELMTLKAARILSRAPVLAHFRKRGQLGQARSIVDGYQHPAAEELALEYPMTTERPFSDDTYRSAVTHFYNESASSIAAHLDAGRDVALVCEGDPFFYGSFMHIFNRLNGTYRVDVVPGIMGMAAAWTRSKSPFTYGDDVLTVLPGTLPLEVLVERMKTADVLVIMKLGSNFAKVRQGLAEAGLVERAIYVERASMPGEAIMRLAEKPDDSAPYFSMILVPGRGRRL